MSPSRMCPHNYFNYQRVFRITDHRLCRPYFVRFSGTPAGAGLVVLQAERILADKDNFNPGNKPIDEIAELGQLFSTLLVLQGVQDIKEEDRKKLFALMLQWVKTMPPVFAVEVVERCLMILEDDA